MYVTPDISFYFFVDFWVVVKFIDDGLLSLLRLQEIENLERTEDGVEASLNEEGNVWHLTKGNDMSPRL